ncbi:MAG TPA: hypothetical protein VGO93_02130 [Candidatus Xenobia bacterium]
MRRKLVLLLLLFVVALAWADDDSCKKPPPELSIGGVKVGQSRADVDQKAGAEVFVESDTHAVHYGNGVIVVFDSGGMVVNVNGPQLEIDGKPSWITTHKALDKALGKGDASEKSVRYPKFGLTAYLNHDGIVGFLLERP